MDMNRILICTQTGCGTGFGRVAETIADALAEKYEVHVVGLGKSTQSRVWEQHDHSDFDPNRISAVCRVAGKLHCSAVILIGQGQLQSWQVSALKSNAFAGAVIAYVPVEGKIYNVTPLVGLLQCDKVVAYTQTGAHEIHSAFQARPDLNNNNLDISVIPHKVERILIDQRMPRESLRTKLFPRLSDRNSGFWILNANRNDERKRPELSLLAFAQVAALHPRATLILHCRSRRRTKNLRIEIAKLSLQKQTFLTCDLATDFFSDAKMSLLYSCCDIGINSALGEGWGLVAFEHAQFQAAQILPAHAGLQEIWGSAPSWAAVAEGVPIDEVFIGQAPIIQAMATSIDELLGDTLKLQQVGKACAAAAEIKVSDSTEIDLQWCRLIATLLSKRKGNLSTCR